MGVNNTEKKFYEIVTRTAVLYWAWHILRQPDYGEYRRGGGKLRHRQIQVKMGKYNFYSSSPTPRENKLEGFPKGDATTFSKTAQNNNTKCNTQNNNSNIKKLDAEFVAPLSKLFQYNLIFVYKSGQCYKTFFVHDLRIFVLS
jgi:hypothetical protein